MSKGRLGPIDSADRIITDVYCIKCAANLRGLLFTEPCTQCGHPASDSVHGDYLIHSRPRDVLRLYDGASVVLYASALIGFVVLLFIVVSALGAGAFDRAVDRAFDAVFAGAMISPIVAVIGIALLTRRHSAEYFFIRYGNRRYLARAGVTLAIAAVLYALAVWQWPRVMHVLTLVAWATVPLALFFRGLEGLMRRAPNLKLAFYARGMLIGVCALGICGAIVLLLRRFGADDEELRGPMLAMTFIAELGSLAIGILGYRLLVKVRTNIRVAAA